MSGDPPIIINGKTSITIEFPEGTFPPESSQKGKFKNANKHIKRVEIIGASAPAYDEKVTGNDIVIKIHYS
jgi:hypothetical protein